MLLSRLSLNQLGLSSIFKLLLKSLDSFNYDDTKISANRVVNWKMVVGNVSFVL